MGVPRRIGLALAVWCLRLAALGALALWFIPEWRYEDSGMTERTYFGLGWPEHWLASEVTLEFRPTAARDGKWSYTVHKRGPLMAWDPVPRNLGLDDAFTYRAWKRLNLSSGPLWQTGAGAVCLVIAAYLNQLRRRPSLVGKVTPMQPPSVDVAHTADGG